MSSFSDLDLSLLNTHKKRPTADINFPPEPLNPDDYMYPRNIPQKGHKRVRLPTMISYKLPPILLNKFNIAQIAVNDVDIKISSQNANSEKGTTNNTSRTSPEKPKIEVETVTPDSAEQRRLYTIKVVSKHANYLKKASVESYESKKYTISILDFTQSYILFVLGLKLTEDTLNLKPKKGATDLKGIHKRLADWLDTYKFGTKIVSNFTEIIKNETDDSTKKYLGHILGLVYYMNGFIQIHRSELILECINILKIENNGENSTELVGLIDDFEDIISDSQGLLYNGENNLGLFTIVRGYPNLWSQSFTKLSNVNKTELILPFDLFVNKKVIPFEHKVNYCLPICSHIWDLNAMLNFSGFFLKEWCLRQNINHELIFNN